MPQFAQGLKERWVVQFGVQCCLSLGFGGLGFFECREHDGLLSVQHVPRTVVEFDHRVFAHRLGQQPLLDQFLSNAHPVFFAFGATNSIGGNGALGRGDFLRL